MKTVKVSERLRDLYFRKYDDQMGALEDYEEKELEFINHVIDCMFHQQKESDIP